MGILSILIIVYALFKGSIGQDCSMVSRSCGDCLTLPECAWCENDTYTGLRCDTVDNLRNNSCYIYNYPVTQVYITKDENLREAVYDSEDDEDPSISAIQIQPQEIRLIIRQGETHTIRVNVKQAIDYPVDLYYLMDLSYSMLDDLQSLKKLGSEIADSIKRLSRRIHLGYGSFVDKPLSPYIDTKYSRIDTPCSTGECEKTYSFRNVLPLHKNLSLFQESVEKVNISGNLDEAEGTLDALMQVAACMGEIGWRDDARRLVIVTTDAPFHIRGDGRLAGILEPHDGRCHLDENREYSKSHLYDYPSIGHLRKTMTENNIIPIFAVEQSVYQLYYEMSKLIKGATVAVLGSDSSNILQIIDNKYEEITRSVEIAHNAPQNIKLNIIANCLDGSEDQQTCSNLKEGQEVSFDVDITVESCTEDGNNQSFVIFPVGINERLNVSVEVICECSCESAKEADSSVCSDGNGTLACGVCDCNPDRYGGFCECEGTSQRELIDISSCKPNNHTDVLCFGRGECVCGECICHESKTEAEKISGQFCGCSHLNCPRSYGGEVCGGPENGQCECNEETQRSECVCSAGYSGDRCDCAIQTETCVSPENGLMCSGIGICECGKCVCKSPEFYGDACDQCVTCNGCYLHIECIKCTIYNNYDELSEDECKMCSQNILKVNSIDKLLSDNDKSSKCSYLNEDGCQVNFLYEDEGNNGTITIYVTDPHCASFLEENYIYFIIGMVLGIVLVGILIIAIFRLYTWYLDKKEFSQFVLSQREADWQKDDNPLYDSGIQTFRNPMYGK